MDVNYISCRPSTAEEEYEKDPNIKKEDIETLRAWAKIQPHVSSNITEKEIICFHHSTYYDIEKTKSCMDSYYKMRQKSPELFGDRDIDNDELRNMNTVLYNGFCPVRDLDGNLIVFQGLKEFNAEIWNHASTVKSYFMLIEGCSYKYGTVSGYIIIVDVKGFGLKHLARAKISIIEKAVRYQQQECMPIRLKAIHVINANRIINIVMTLIRPFMKTELLKKIHFHSNMETMHAIINKDYLPSDYGGNLESRAEMQENFIDLMRNMKTYFVEQEANLYGSDLI